MGKSVEPSTFMSLTFIGKQFSCKQVTEVKYGDSVFNVS